MRINFEQKGVVFVGSNPVYVVISSENKIS